MLAFYVLNLAGYRMLILDYDEPSTFIVTDAVTDLVIRPVILVTVIKKT